MKQAKYAIFSLLFVVFCGLHPAVAWAAEGGAALNEAGILNVLAALEIMNGDESGSLNLSSGVTRAEFTKMVLAASSTAAVQVNDVIYY